MSRIIKITKNQSATNVEIIKKGKSTIYSINSSRTLFLYNEGIIIVANQEESVLNNFKIPFNEVHDKLGATTSRELLTKFEENGYFKKGGGSGLGSGSGNFSKTITATINIGGIKAGDQFLVGSPVEKAIEKLAVKYVPPVINGFTINHSKLTPVIGESINFSEANFNIQKDSDNANPQNVYISGPEFNVAIADGITNHSVGLKTIVKTTRTSQSWTLSAEDINGDNINSRTINIHWSHEHLFGSSNQIINTNNFQAILDGLNPKTLNSKTTNWYAYEANNNPANYTYIAYANVYGDLNSVILNSAAPVLSAFTKIGVFNWVNAYGVMIPMIVYKSNATGAFSQGDKITTS